MIDQQFASAKDTEEQAYELKGKYEDALKSAKDESMRIVNPVSYTHLRSEQ